MEARSIILREIDYRALMNKSTQRKAILTLIADVKTDLQHENEIQHLTPELLKAAKDASGRGKGLARSTIFAWKKSYAEHGIAGLVPRATYVAPPIDITYPWFPNFMRFYASPTKPALSHALDMYSKSLKNGEKEPNYAQVKRAIKALKGSANFLDAYKGREGPLALKARLAFVSRTTEGLEPTTIYTADGKTFDAEVAHPIHGGPFKPEITSILDVVTRKCVGWSLGLAENAENVADALRRACETNGIPAIFYVDRGPGYKNLRLGDATTGLCNRLGMTKTHSIPQNSQARGIIERFNGTVWNRLSKEYLTYLGADMDREAAQKIHKLTRKDPSKLLQWDDFVADVATAISEYNDRAHSALKRIVNPITGRKRHASPNEAWAWFEETGFVSFPVSKEESNDLFRPYVRRKVRRCLIDWLTNEYFSQELDRWNGRDVLVGYDTQDASRVWVREIDQVDGETALGPLICVAEYAGNQQRYMPVTFEKSALEKRGRQALKRIDKKRQRILDETNQPLTIEATAEQPMAPLFASKEEIEARVVLITSAPKLRSTHPDVELALKVLADPSCRTPGWTRILNDMMNRRAGSQILEDAGVDLKELTIILNSTPATPSSSAIGEV